MSAFIYAIDLGWAIKIGRTENLWNRMYSFGVIRKRGNWQGRLIGLKRVRPSRAAALERHLHASLHKHKYVGEFYHRTKEVRFAVTSLGLHHAAASLRWVKP